MKKKSKRFKVVVCGAVVAVVLGGVLAGTRVLRSKRVSADKVVKQSTTQLSKMNLINSISASGTIASRKTQTVSVSMNDVTVKKVYVKVGDQVKKGDRIVSFDGESLDDSLSDAKEALSDAKTSAASEIESAQTQYDEALNDQSYKNAKASKNLKKAKQEKEAAKKKLQEAKKKLAAAQKTKKKTAERNEESLTAAQEAVTKAQESYSQAVTALETARDNKTETQRQNSSTVRQAKTSLDNAKTNGQKSIREAEKQVETAQESVDKCAVTAPMDGVVTSLGVEKGDSYSGGTIAQIDDTSGYTITTSVDEYDISSIKKGQKVVILTEATDEDELEGVVTFVAPSTGSSSSTGTESSGNSMGNTESSGSDGYEVKIRLKKKDSRLKLGMTAKCSIVKEEADDVFAVPYDAVSEGQDGSCYITVAAADSGEKGTDSTKTQTLTVTKGLETDYYVEISGDGLREGMNVVVPTDKVSSGEKSDSDQKGMGDFGKMGNMNGGGMPGGNGNNAGGKGGFGGGPGGDR